MNKQEVFDRVVKHARTQKKRATTKNLFTGLKCKYRTKDGCKCFIGCLIPDDMYSPSMEGNGIGGIPLRPVLDLLEADRCADLGFLSNLQTIHDTREPRHWEFEFKAFASSHDLIYSNPE